MMNYIRDLRLIPIAVIACVCLLALKAADLLLDGGSLIAGDNAPVALDDENVADRTAFETKLHEFLFCQRLLVTAVYTGLAVSCQFSALRPATRCSMFPTRGSRFPATPFYLLSRTNLR